MKTCPAWGFLRRLPFPKKLPLQGSGPDLYFHKSPDSHGQVFDLAGILNSQIKKGTAESPGANNSADAFSLGRIVIVLPSSETLFPVLYHALPLIPSRGIQDLLGAIPSNGHQHGVCSMSHAGRHVDGRRHRLISPTHLGPGPPPLHEEPLS